MKRHGFLFDRIITFQNLAAAARNALRGKKPGAESETLFLDLENELLRLHGELASGSYRPGPYHTFWVNDPKRRLICAAPLRDRVVHHAICRVIGPFLDSRQIVDSYACRKGKGQHAALRRAQRLAQQYPFFARADVRKFFDSVDHQTLEARLHRTFKDPHLLKLLSTIIRQQNPALPAGRGIPIGNLTSQHFANFYLSSLDFFIKQHLHAGAYLRYMDDIVFYANDRDTLHGWLYESGEFLQDRLSLEWKQSACFVSPVAAGIPFLGCRVFPSVIRLQQRSKIRFFRKWNQRERQWEAGEIGEDKFLQSASSLLGHVQQVNTREMCRSFFGDQGRRRQEPRQSRRQLEQRRRELPVGESQQQFAGQPQQQRRLSSVSEAGTMPDG